jgi:DNA-directed RNA polymerase specialized sigma24 family protein
MFAPRGRSVITDAIAELRSIIRFVSPRVGHPADAEDLTQQVALKAPLRLREETPVPAAHSVLATFWAGPSRLPASEVPEDVPMNPDRRELLPTPQTAPWVTQILDSLRASQRRVLELRFLGGCSLCEVADEITKSVGAVKVMQHRALRRAASVAYGLQLSRKASEHPRRCR